MNNPKIISIDPGHGGYGICHYDEPNTTDPHKATFITGKEKPNTLGCPALVNDLLSIPDINQPIIVIEETFIHSLIMISVMNTNHIDIGYIIKALEPIGATVYLCSNTEWKVNLADKGILPPKSGHMKPDAYKAALDSRFGMDLKHDAWSAWGIHKWAFDNIENENTGDR